MANQALGEMEKAFKETRVMETFYERNHYIKGGGPGGRTFVGKDLRKILAPESLEELRLQVGDRGSLWIDYLDSIRDYYQLAVQEQLADDSYLDMIEAFKNAFNALHQQWNLSETPKNHILAVHVGEYMALHKETLWSSNDENLEACHQLGTAPLIVLPQTLSETYVISLVIVLTA